MPNATKSNGKPEVCAQCAKDTGQPHMFCGLMGAEYEFYVLDCQSCGKTIVDRFGRCCAANCESNHGGRWHLTFDKNGAFIKLFNPSTGQSLVHKDEDA